MISHYVDYDYYQGSNYNICDYFILITRVMIHMVLNGITLMIQVIMRENSNNSRHDLMFMTTNYFIALMVIAEVLIISVSSVPSGTPTLSS